MRNGGEMRCEGGVAPGFSRSRTPLFEWIYGNRLKAQGDLPATACLAGCRQQW